MTSSKLLKEGLILGIGTALLAVLAPPFVAAQALPLGIGAAIGMALNEYLGGNTN